MDQKVFVNRILNMKKIKLIGLDMDHTLIRYNTKNFETLVYNIVVEKLITDKGYPVSIREFTFNFNDAIRGLIVDSSNGNILKLSRYGAIRQSYHGTKPISYPEQKKIYRSIYVDLKDPNYMAIDTSFSIAFCVLYGQLVDYKDQYPDELPGYGQIALDVLSSVDKAHADGSIKNYISQNLGEYVHKDKAVVEGLKRVKRYGKKIFILTNSEYYYTKLLLEYAINPFLEPGEDWRDLFEYVITLAGKPRFFYDNPRFLAVNPLDGTMTNFHGGIKPGIYQGGCARKFTEDLEVKGDEILYIGDHIYGDILRLKKDCNWRTALVVEELSEEIESQTRALPVERQIIAAMETKKELEQNYIDAYTKSIDENTEAYQDEINSWQQQIVAIDNQITKLLREQQTFYNPRWGRVFRAGAEESYFAYQVDRFACIYMERLSDLLAHSPLTYFRANRRRLAHDVEL
ncbi:cytosolic IMP-GMP specific 5'-nucleotidase [Legionella beliardensis]|uniref:Cytosolic IMP-GMP specific 5'-nucleotidase n=1 Tax=Legionella beliardensis TaxID=91822 RepID=A0A378IAV9_9GAMM|nr:HAD-IG family 5'-nucleotidase [Legionella beliardensis]STX29454.1 cytosolic IMP-GMP specific 5'-nucleotidase [Legionella beliardensis]